MRIFVYEFITGGGWHSHDAGAPPDSLRDEGRAMVIALAADFAAIAGAQVDVLLDAREQVCFGPAVSVQRVASAADERAAIESLTQTADWTVLIAPEFDEHLLARTRWVEQSGGRLLGPSSQVVALAADKHDLAIHLAARGVPVPQGIALADDEVVPGDFRLPAVLKPRDGAGSLGVVRIDAENRNQIRTAEPARIETFCPGIAASVACLCGPAGVTALVPCLQHLTENFTYQGGSLPLPPELATRAQKLAERAVGSLPNPLGYLGVDLVLGDDSHGREDYVIEINPRLTTSYVGLRAFSRVNLAAAMIAVAAGGDARLCWNSGGIAFTSTGEIRPDTGSARQDFGKV